MLLSRDKRCEDSEERLNPRANDTLSEIITNLLQSPVVQFPGGTLRVAVAVNVTGKRDEESAIIASGGFNQTWQSNLTWIC
jgi:hypothetical protein